MRSYYQTERLNEGAAAIGAGLGALAWGANGLIRRKGMTRAIKDFHKYNLRGGMPRDQSKKSLKRLRNIAYGVGAATDIGTGAALGYGVGKGIQRYKNRKKTNEDMLELQAQVIYEELQARGLI